MCPTINSFKYNQYNISHSLLHNAGANIINDFRDPHSPQNVR